MTHLSDLASEMDKTVRDLKAAKNEHSRLLAELGVAPDAAGEAKLTSLESRMRRLQLNADRLETLVEAAEAADRAAGREEAQKKAEAARAKLIGLLPQAVEEAAAMDAALESFLQACRVFRAGGVKRRELASEVVNASIDKASDPYLEHHALAAGLVMGPASGSSGAITHSLSGVVYTIAESLGIQSQLASYWQPKGTQINRGEDGTYSSFAEATRQDVAMVKARI